MRGRSESVEAVVLGMMGRGWSGRRQALEGEEWARRRLLVIGRCREFSIGFHGGEGWPG